MKKLLYVLFSLFFIAFIFYFGVGYYIAYKNQQRSEDPIWALIKFFSILAFLCLTIVETIMWANLSVNFEMSDALRMGSNKSYTSLGVGLNLDLITFDYVYMHNNYLHIENNQDPLIIRSLYHQDPP